MKTKTYDVKRKTKKKMKNKKNEEWKMENEKIYMKIKK